MGGIHRKIGGEGDAAGRTGPAGRPESAGRRGGPALDREQHKLRLSRRLAFPRELSRQEGHPRQNAIRTLNPPRPLHPISWTVCYQVAMVTLTILW